MFATAIPATSRYPSWIVPTGLVLSIFAAYAWLQIPVLKPYALQAFAVGVLVFFATKYLTQKKPFSLLPDPYSLEIIPLTFALLLLIGSTGSSSSGFFALMYVLLFLLVLTTNFVTTIITTAGMMLFVYATSDLTSNLYWQALLSIPLMTLFFIYTEQQLMLSKKQASLMEIEEEKLASAQTKVSTLADYLEHFLRPKLISLLNLGAQPDTPKSTILKQLDLLLSETEKLEKKIVQNQDEQQ